MLATMLRPMYDQSSSQIAEDRILIVKLVVVVVDSFTIKISRKQVFEHVQKPDYYCDLRS